jgi:hypothetical protein
VTFDSTNERHHHHHNTTATTPLPEQQLDLSKNQIKACIQVQIQAKQL